jgi:O-succinylhomoserine sulfhydrylase
MEGAADGCAFATGMAAVFGTFAALLNSGDHIIICPSRFWVHSRTVYQNFPQVEY